jgi:hypothetical protein
MLRRLFLSTVVLLPLLGAPPQPAAAQYPPGYEFVRIGWAGSQVFPSLNDYGTIMFVNVTPEGHVLYVYNDGFLFAPPLGAFKNSSPSLNNLDEFAWIRMPIGGSISNVAFTDGNEILQITDTEQLESHPALNIFRDIAWELYYPNLPGPVYDMLKYCAISGATTVLGSGNTLTWHYYPFIASENLVCVD